jgi:hypothetical protein
MPVQVIYITAALLFVGVFPLPLEYYNLMKIVAFGTFAWGSYTNFGRKKILLPLVYGLLAILFNPIAEITLPKEFWIGIDPAAAIFLLVTKRHFTE